MVWRYLKNNTKPKNYHFENDMLWHIKDSINNIQIRLISQAVQQLKPVFDLAYKYKKPLKFYLNGNIRSVLGKIILDKPNKPDELSIETFSENIDVAQLKQNKETTNGVHIYYNWADVPPRLQQFILHKKNKENSIEIDIP